MKIRMWEESAGVFSGDSEVFYPVRAGWFPYGARVRAVSPVTRRMGAVPTAFPLGDSPLPFTLGNIQLKGVGNFENVRLSAESGSVFTPYPSEDWLLESVLVHVIEEVEYSVTLVYAQVDCEPSCA